MCGRRGRGKGEFHDTRTWVWWIVTSCPLLTGGNSPFIVIGLKQRPTCTPPPPHCFNLQPAHIPLGDVKAAHLLLSVGKRIELKKGWHRSEESYLWQGERCSKSFGIIKQGSDRGHVCRMYILAFWMSVQQRRSQAAQLRMLFNLNDHVGGAWRESNLQARHRPAAWIANEFSQAPSARLRLKRSQHTAAHLNRRLAALRKNLVLSKPSTFFWRLSLLCDNPIISPRSTTMQTEAAAEKSAGN